MGPSSSLIVRPSRPLVCPNRSTISLLVFCLVNPNQALDRNQYHCRSSATA
ncbi:hypothetical protein Hanom_Chr06g00486861 [Helianthus anomalus]